MSSDSGSVSVLVLLISAEPSTLLTTRLLLIGFKMVPVICVGLNDLNKDCSSHARIVENHRVLFVD